MEALSFQDMVERTRESVEAFRKVETRPWTIETTIIELSKQVGDLAKRVLMYERYYLPDRDRHPAYHTTLDNIANELADVLYCLIRVALHYGIDLEVAYVTARQDELGYAAQSAVIDAPAAKATERRAPPERDDYNPVLDEHYVWMYGGEDKNIEAYEAFFRRHHLAPERTGKALDLGCGSGFQSLAMARLGFQVLGVDISPVLLRALEQHRGDLPVSVAQGDIRDPAVYDRAGPFDVAVCMTDTILCLGGEDEIWQLLANVGKALVPGGRLFVSFRDFKKAATGSKRVFPVRSDANRIWTTLIEFLPRTVRVNDMLYLNEGGAWQLYAGTYAKSRLSPERFLEMLGQTGFVSDPPFVDGPLTYCIARRH
ncbi:methyltransferase domain-containing protein [Roseospira marina]|nr:methyltransferase domain-containing protein [Roseospira marina]MBB4313510.1 SAM-dependent methyltransferase/NTP pyrophosphatase (non-canonical NTP hydrolase) [Roseospira marina]MBB5086672.1 SAM-dependent methyltransferase/NTP pyrophosphatase (non-canonical NTP hydrolase) [Roseospira marina]